MHERSWAPFPEQPCMLRSEQDRVEKLADSPEDPGSEVDWGDESVKDEKEEPSSEGDEGEEKPIVPAGC